MVEEFAFFKGRESFRMDMSWATHYSTVKERKVERNNWFKLNKKSTKKYNSKLKFLCVSNISCTFVDVMFT